MFVTYSKNEYIKSINKNIINRIIHIILYDMSNDSRYYTENIFSRWKFEEKYINFVTIISELKQADFRSK